MGLNDKAQEEHFTWTSGKLQFEEMLLFSGTSLQYRTTTDVRNQNRKLSGFFLSLPVIEF